MNNNNLNRFFELVGSDSENYNENNAKSIGCDAFVAECMSLVNDNPTEYGSVSEELEQLAIQFWNYYN